MTEFLLQSNFAYQDFIMEHMKSVAQQLADAGGTATDTITRYDLVDPVRMDPLTSDLDHSEILTFLHDFFRTLTARNLGP